MRTSSYSCGPPLPRQSSSSSWAEGFGKLRGRSQFACSTSLHTWNVCSTCENSETESNPTDRNGIGLRLEEQYRIHQAGSSSTTTQTASSKSSRDRAFAPLTSTFSLSQLELMTWRRISRLGRSASYP